MLLQGGDVISKSQTGSGKTAAFALPIIQKVDPAVRAPQALILCPSPGTGRPGTRGECEARPVQGGVQELPIYGGAAYDRQLRGLQSGAQIIIGTPGRVIDHLDRKSLKLDQVHTLVLNEADRMLDMGFRRRDRASWS